MGVVGVAVESVGFLGEGESGGGGGGGCVLEI
jgi:hypothetical protein